MKMKNKKEEQIALKKKHLENLKNIRRKAPLLDRGKPTKTEKPTILIVCEGKNTEPSYFKQFKLSTATIKPIGEGYNTLSLVNRAIHHSQQREYDQTWCVFDKDDFNNIDFNNAITLAQSNSFGVAYSNQAFEYWIILHFNDHQGGGINRNDYDKILNEHLKEYNISYNGKTDKIITNEIFEVLESIDNKTGISRRIQAINRAKRNYNLLSHSNPANEESSTTVFKLVEELDKHR
jgi:hypothetical protein